mmetsp:Transcript_41392/g.96662  ORF Transcript_41392/g.96662 Transcript_41392/m.96662 type:complete len:207 (+) Transcript_41392:127-747(+)
MLRSKVPQASRCLTLSTSRGSTSPALPCKKTSALEDPEWSRFRIISFPQRHFTSPGTMFAGITFRPVPTTKQTGELRTAVQERPRAPAGRASPNIVTSGFRTPPVSGCLGYQLSVAMSARRLPSGFPSRAATHWRRISAWVTCSFEDMHVAVAMVPWISITFLEPALWWSESIFCVMTVRSLPRSSSSTRARWAAFGSASRSPSRK